MSSSSEDDDDEEEGEQGSPRSGEEDDGDKEEDEAKTIATIDVGRMNNGADDPDANKDGCDGDGDSDDNGVAMLANGTEV